MAKTMTHPTYGTRVVQDEHVEHKTRLGWTDDGEAVPPEVDGTVTKVLADVGTDPHKARAALAAEQDRTSPRTSLVTALARIAEPDTKES